MSDQTVSRRTYLLVYLALVVLTGLTLLVSRFPLGAWETPIALLIAVAKAALVLLYFMHLIHSSRLTWVVALGSLLWLAILIVLTLNDYIFRP